MATTMVKTNKPNPRPTKMGLSFFAIAGKYELIKIPIKRGSAKTVKA